MSQENESQKAEILMPNITIQLTGLDGNVFSIIARVRSAMRKAGELDSFDKFYDEVTSGDYYHALATVAKWFTVQ
jgi:hypothetical protein